MSLSKRKQFTKLCSREIFISSLWWNWKLIKTCSIIFSVKVFWVSRSIIRRADLFLFYFHSGIQQFSRNYERNNMYLGRCKLSRPGSPRTVGGKRLSPFPQTNILFTGYEGIKKSAREASRAVVAFLPPSPPPSLRSLVPGQCKLQTCGGVPVFWGSFRSWEGGGGG